MTSSVLDYRVQDHYNYVEPTLMGNHSTRTEKQKVNYFSKLKFMNQSQLSLRKQIKLLYFTNIIDEFSELDDNWNGYGAMPISRFTINNAKSIIAQLQKMSFFMNIEVFPTARDSIQFEFVTKTMTEYEIEVCSDGVKVLIEESNGEYTEFEKHYDYINGIKDIMNE